jgi:hypothetical protein
MLHENITALPSPLESVRDRFEQWRETRKNRRERIPEDLWSAAVRLCDQYSVNRISRTLGLNYNDLKKRIPACLHACLSKTACSQATHRQNQKAYTKRNKLSSTAFIEVDWRNGFPSSECIIEMDDAYGSKMRMSFKGRTELDLLELGKAFWTKGE